MRGVVAGRIAEEIVDVVLGGHRTGDDDGVAVFGIHIDNLLCVHNLAGFVEGRRLEDVVADGKGGVVLGGVLQIPVQVDLAVVAAVALEASPIAVPVLDVEHTGDDVAGRDLRCALPGDDVDRPQIAFLGGDAVGVADAGGDVGVEVAPAQHQRQWVVLVGHVHGGQPIAVEEAEQVGNLGFGCILAEVALLQDQCHRPRGQIGPARIGAVQQDLGVNGIGFGRHRGDERLRSTVFAAEDLEAGRGAVTPEPAQQCAIRRSRVHEAGQFVVRFTAAGCAGRAGDRAGQRGKNVDRPHAALPSGKELEGTGAGKADAVFLAGVEHQIEGGQDICLPCRNRLYVRGGRCAAPCQQGQVDGVGGSAAQRQRDGVDVAPDHGVPALDVDGGGVEAARRRPGDDNGVGGGGVLRGEDGVGPEGEEAQEKRRQQDDGADSVLKFQNGF